MVFSERRKLAEKVDIYIKEKNINDDTFGVICVLEIWNMLSEPVKKIEFTKDKPDFACIFLAKHKGEYSLYKFCWEIGEASENDMPTFYLAWFELSNDSSEYDAYDECAFDEYLVLEKLPTMEETHKAWLEQNKEHF